MCPLTLSSLLGTFMDARGVWAYITQNPTKRTNIDFFKIPMMYLYLRGGDLLTAPYLFLMYY
jgi:hypothetical protein